MDRVRFGLWFGLLATLWISYSTWISDNRPEPVEANAEDPAGVPAASDDDAVPVPTEDSGSVPVVDAGGDGVPVGAPGEAEPPARTITVETDVLDLVISLEGGDIVRAELPEYPVSKDNPDVPIRLLDYAPENRWVFQTGIVSGAGGPAPDHEQPFTADASAYRLADGAESLEVRLRWDGGNGLSAEKIYTFRRGSYEIGLEILAENGSAAPWPANAYLQMTRLHDAGDRSFLDVDSYSFTGPVLYDGDQYQKLDFEDLAREPIRQTFTNGWFASIQHHFLAAVVPPADEPASYQAQTVGQSYRLTMLSPGTTVAPGETFRYDATLFVGPKLQDQLDAAAPGRELKRTVDYGVLYFLSQPLFFVLDFIHGWVGNWGWSIVITTILIKLVFYRLTATSGRSMAKMRKLAPRMKALQEKHKEDRQALSAAMMELYKKEKVNPAAGCLPILVQMPFFFAFYWVLIESVEMRQAPFMLWINDLSVRDPFFILPALMCGSMWFQMRLNPAPPDPVQARVMQIMPFVFAAMFAFFPAGLVLYWLTNTVISIAQQWRINQLVAREA